MADTASNKIFYGKEKVQIKLAPAKDESISVFTRPGDKVSFDFDVSKAAFKLVGGDIVVKMPDGGEIVFVSMAQLAFEENPPQIILSNGQPLEIEGILMQVDEVKESPIESMLTDEAISLKEELAALDKEMADKKASLEAKAQEIEDKAKELESKAQEQEAKLEEQRDMAEKLQESQIQLEEAKQSQSEEQAELENQKKMIQIEDVDVNPDVAEENDYNAYFRPVEDASSSASNISSADVTATLDVEVGFFQTQKEESIEGDKVSIVGGGGSVRARYDGSGEAQLEAEIFDYSSSDKKMDIIVDNPEWFDESSISKLISLNVAQPEGFKVETIKINGLADDFEIVGGSKSGDSWVITRDGFKTIGNEVELVLKYKSQTTHNDFSINFEIHSMFSEENIEIDPLNPIEIVTPDNKELLALKQVGIQVKDIENSDDYIYDGNQKLGFVLAREANENIILTSQNDTKVVGGFVSDDITSFGGNDTINAMGGDDKIVAGEGDDTIDGGDGIDLLDYQNAKNGVSVDLKIGTASGEGSDKISNIENLIGSLHDDTLIGEDGVNIIEGKAGHDEIKGGGGDDTLIGGEDNDKLSGGAGNDILIGGSGSDSADFSDSANAITAHVEALDLKESDEKYGTAIGEGEDRLEGIENLIGSNYGDSLFGDDGINELIGNGGNDYFVGGKGNDNIDGGEGVDTIDYSHVVESGLNVDLSQKFASGEGFDSVVNIEKIIATSQDDKLVGDDGNNIFLADKGDDYLDGKDGDDELIAGAGDDTLKGGAGNDTLDGGEDGLYGDWVDYSSFGVDEKKEDESEAKADDTEQVEEDKPVVYEPKEGISINLSSGTASGEGEDKIINIEHVQGSKFDDVIVGNEKINTLKGYDGYDRLVGGAGDDVIDGGSGLDTVDFSSFNESVEIDLKSKSAIGDGMDTLISIENAEGSSVDDKITGDANSNILSGNSGNDEIFGLSGNDTLLGGSGDDKIDGGSGDDFIDGGENGSEGDEVDYSSASMGVKIDLSMSEAQDSIGAGMDTIINIENVRGSNLDDTLLGNNQNNKLYGGSGKDNLIAQDGDDFLYGEMGDDTLVGGKGNDYIDGGDDVDLLDNSSLDSSIYVDLSKNIATGAGDDTILNIENISGSSVDDILIGDDNDNLLIGNGGNDTLIGKGGNDRLDGGEGEDSVSYEDAIGSIDASLESGVVSGEGLDRLVDIENISGSSFDDLIKGDSNDNKLFGNSGLDEIYGKDGADDIFGGKGDDKLFGDEGDDTLKGDEGDDTLSGGAGNDTLDGGEGLDVADYSLASEAINLDLSFSGDKDIGGGQGIDSFVSIEGVIGTSFDDTLKGDDQDNILMGRGGDDYLDGGLGDDLLDGGEGVDSADYSSSSKGVLVDLNIEDEQDTLGAGMDILKNIENLHGSDHNDILIGNESINVLDGSKGDDTLAGGLGNDTLIGGDGSDSIDYSKASGKIDIDLEMGVAKNDGFGSSDTLESIENIIGSQNSDKIFGDDSVNILDGNSGNDLLFGGGGDDTLVGGAGDDTFIGESGDDEIDGGIGEDSVDYSALTQSIKVDLDQAKATNSEIGTDHLISIERVVATNQDDILGGDNSDNIFLGNGGDDKINGLGGDDSLFGGSGNDSLDGSDGDDFISGGDGDDTLKGGLGNDVFAGGDGKDSIDFSDLNNMINVDLSLGIVAGEGSDTVSGVENIIGSNQNDRLIGNSFVNTIYGNDGADFIDAKGGNDTIDAGEGDDILRGGEGDDFLKGGDGLDRADYGDASIGVEVDLSLGASQDTKGAGIDQFDSIENVSGSLYDDTLSGDGGVNQLSGNMGNDTLSGLGGDDTLMGESGDDTLMGGVGNDRLIGGSGNDSVDYSASSSLTLSLREESAVSVSDGIDTLESIENIIASSHDDTIEGNSSDNILIGGDGEDLLTFKNAIGTVQVDLSITDFQNTSSEGKDKIIGFENLEGSIYADVLVGNDSINKIDGNLGDDTIKGAGGDDVIDGNIGSDLLFGNDGDDTINGGVGDDIIDGGVGADTLDGGLNDDTFVSSEGVDTIDGGAGEDSVDYSLAGAISINLDGANSATVSINGVDDDTIKNVENVIGSNQDDLIVGDSFDNKLFGNSGTDNLDGSDGSDRIEGNGGNDQLKGGEGDDTLYGNSGNDTLSGGSGDDFIDGGDGEDSIDYSLSSDNVKVTLRQTNAQNTGDATGIDTIYNIENVIGSAHNDTIEGDSGDNILEGGLGVDTLSFKSALSGVSVDLGITTKQNTIGDGEDTISGFENLTGSLKEDTLKGDGANNIIHAESADDIIYTSNGNDQLFGDSGNDKFIASLSDGTDTMDGGSGSGDEVDYSNLDSKIDVTLNSDSEAVVTIDGGDSDSIKNIEHISGSSVGDNLVGDLNANHLKGNGGDDTLSGQSGNDTLEGGAGDDTIISGSGNDIVDGGEGSHDRLDFSNSGSGVSVNLSQTDIQTISLLEGDDKISGIEDIVGSSLSDNLSGSDGVNTIFGGHGSDTIDGGEGDDQLFGEGEDDIFVSKSALDGVDIYDGGDGSDSVDYSSLNEQISVTLNGVNDGSVAISGGDSDTLKSIENIIGSRADNHIVGDERDNILTGNIGRDTLEGADGDDTLIGKANEDTLIGGSGSDKLEGGSGSDRLEGGDDNDSLYGDGGDDVLEGGSGDDYIEGGNHDTLGDTLSYENASSFVQVNLKNSNPQYTGASTGTDTIRGIENILGSDYDDTIEGDSGDNRLDGGDGIDTISFENVNSGIDVDLNIGTSQDTKEGQDTIVNFENIIGSQYGDNLYGDDGVNIIDAKDGSDTINGGAGDDDLRGGSGNDLFISQVGDGSDSMDGGLGSSDEVSYQALNSSVVVSLDQENEAIVSIGGVDEDSIKNIENITGSKANDILTGDQKNNILKGDSGNDTLKGDFGKDTLMGGVGDDVLSGDGGDDIIDGGDGKDSVDYSSSVNSVSVDLSNNANQFIGLSENSDTLLNIENIIGSNSDDTLLGSSGINEIHGAFGDDTIDGGSEDDILNGDGGDDVFITNLALDGSDVVDGGDGQDSIDYSAISQSINVVLDGSNSSTVTISGGDSDSIKNIENVIGSSTHDTIRGDGLDNTLKGSGGNDTLEGKGGDDFIYGGDGEDTLSFENASSSTEVNLKLTTAQDTHVGLDTIREIENVLGSGFDDTIEGNNQDNILDGGDGEDSISYENAGAVSVDLANESATGDGNDTLLNFENIIGSSFGDTFVGNSGVNKIYGGGENDTFIAFDNDGSDIFDGGAGNRDHVDYGALNSSIDVVLDGENSVNVTVGDGDNDSIKNIENVSGSKVDDNIVGDDEKNRLSGNAGDDVISGGGNNDRLYGGAGDDALSGGSGDDIIDGGSGSDSVDYSSSLSKVSVDLSLTTEQNISLTEGKDTITNIENIIASNLDDTLKGDENSNILEGRSGDDILEGRGGSDTLYGGDGVDSADYSNIDKSIDITLDGLNLKTVTIVGGDNDQLKDIENILGSNQADTLRGDNLSNKLIGNGGNDTIEGGLGDDTLDGNGGEDTLSFESANVGIEVTLKETTQNTNVGTDSISGFENVIGSSNDDTIEGDSSDNKLDGGVSGNDSVSFLDAVGGVIANLFTKKASGDGDDDINNFDNIIGSTHADTLIGDANVNILDGNIGNDTIDGGEGADILQGGEGADTFVGSSFEGDTIDGGEGSSDKVDYSALSNGVDLNLDGSTSVNVTTLNNNHTLKNIEDIIGTNRDDFISGDDKSNEFFGNGGDDELWGELGDDTLRGGDNDDLIYGGSGFDKLYGDSGDDRIFGGESNDDLFGGEGDDTLSGDAGIDVISGNEGDDTLSGGTGDDVFYGGDDVADSGNDTADYSSAITAMSVSLADGYGEGSASSNDQGSDKLYGIENVIGSNIGDDNISGNSDANILEGRGGEDHILGLSGEDTIYGGNQNDTLEGGDESDEIYGQSGDDEIQGDDGDDLLSGGSGDDTFKATDVNDGIDTIDGGDGNDGVDYSVLDNSNSLTIDLADDSGISTVVLNGSNNDSLVNIENITASQGSDVISGNNISNRLMGENGDDTLSGEGGNDTLIGGNGSDTVSYAYELNQSVEVDLLSGSGVVDALDSDTLESIENVIGGSQNDTIIGNNGVNTLNGGDGNDLLSGLDGADLLIGGSGSDSADYSNENALSVTLQNAGDSTATVDGVDDVLREIENIIGSNSGNDNITGNDQVNTILGQSGDDTLGGGAGDDRVDGGVGADTITGGAGADTLIGGTGNDLFIQANGHSGDDIDGGADTDTIDYHDTTSSIDITLNTSTTTVVKIGGVDDHSIVNIENIIGSANSDNLIGDSADNTLIGNGGVDYLDAKGGADYINGGAGDDELHGGEGADELRGDIGEDTLYGEDDNDKLYGGADNDLLDGGEGENYLYGESGDDTLLGGSDIDRLYGGAGNDSVDYSNEASTVNVSLSAGTASGGSIGNDFLYDIENVVGGSNADTLIGDGSINILQGGAGNDTISAGDNADVVEGGSGDDMIIAGAGNDYIDGGEGNDTLDYSEFDANGINVDLSNSSSQTINAEYGDDTILSIENVIGGDLADNIIGNDEANIIEGGGDRDNLSGGAGDDTLQGGLGDDTLKGGAGNDTLEGNSGSGDIVDYRDIAVDINANFENGVVDIAGGEQDLISGIEHYLGGSANDIVVGNLSDNSLSGFDGNDTLSGFSGADSLMGGNGDDLLSGGLGADLINGGADTDTATYEGYSFGVDVDLSGATGSGVDSQGTTDVLVDIENVTGSENSDTLKGDDGVNVLNGMGGDDLLIGANSGDTLLGGSGSDTIDFSDGTEGIDVNLSSVMADRVQNDGFGNIDIIDGIENIIGTSFVDNIIGDTQNNALSGGDGDDILSGKEGTDNLQGGDGDDLLSGGAGDDTINGGAGNHNTLDYRQSASPIVAELSNNRVTGEGLDTISNIQDVLGSLYNDTIIGDSGVNTLKGDGGDDTISGGAESDILMGEAGDDFLQGGLDGDTLYGGDDSADSGSDWADYSQLNAIAINADLANNRVENSSDNTKFDTTSGIENIRGTLLADTLKGDDDTNIINTIEGNDGNDTIYSSIGSDVFDGGNGVDTLDYTAVANSVNLDLSLQKASDGGDGAEDIIKNIEKIIGSTHDDALLGDSGNNTLIGGDGDDLIKGKDGDDLLEGGANNDELYGGIGTDTLRGGDEDDTLYGESGDDNIDGGSGNDIIYTGVGNDTILGGGDNDTLVYVDRENFITVNLSDGGTNFGEITTAGGEGTDILNDHIETIRGTNKSDFIQGFNGTDDGSGNFDDTLLGEGANDTIYGGIGDDSLDGGSGNDILRGQSGNDSIEGGIGTDTLSFDEVTVGGVEVYLDKSGYDATYNVLEDGYGGKDIVSGVEYVSGSQANDTIKGDNNYNYIEGNSGDDLLLASGGSDYFDGEDGEDTLSFKDITNGIKVELFNGAAVGVDIGNVTISNIENITGTDVVDTIYGNSENNILDGGGDNDEIWGRSGNDTLRGGSGDDLLMGEAGVDSYDGGDGQDKIDFYDTGASVEVDLLNSRVVDDGYGNSEESVENIENIGGTKDFGDTLKGDNSANIIYGYGGADTLYGEDGADTLYGNTGEDTLYGGAGADILSGGDSSDILYGGDGVDSYDGGDGVDTISFDDITGVQGVEVSLDALDVTNDGYGNTETDVLVSIENIVGSQNSDILQGDINNNVINAGDGDDRVVVSLGEDKLYGEGGTNTLDLSSMTSSTRIETSKVTIGGSTSYSNISDFQNIIGSDYNDVVYTHDQQNADNDINTGKGNDVIYAFAGDDVVDAGDGNDIIFGYSGDDIIDGGAGIDWVRYYYGESHGVIVNLADGKATDDGNGDEDTLTSIENISGGDFADQITGDANNNYLYGGNGNDIIYGGDGIDHIEGQNNQDTLYGEAGNDVINGGADEDIIYGGNGDDTITGGDGDDTITGGDGDDTIYGNNNADIFYAGLGVDYYDGGDDIDEIIYGTTDVGIQLDLSAGTSSNDGFGNSESVLNFEHVSGSQHDDIIIGNDEVNIIRGGAGDDTIKGGLGNDELFGDDGIDTIDYSGSDAVSLDLVQNSAVRVIDGVEDTDTITSFENVIGSDGNDVIKANDSVNTLIGGSGNDKLYGFAENDTLQGDAGNDILEGGSGDDIIKGGDGIDSAQYLGASSFVSVDLAITTAQNTSGDGIDTLTSIENLTGSTYSDTLYGDSNNNTIKGKSGNDNIFGRDGNDRLYGGSGDDTFILEDGDDFIDGGTNSDTLDLSSYGSAIDITLDGANDVVLNYNGIDTIKNIENLIGTSSNDTLNGDNLNNHLESKDGDDTLRGGTGTNTLDGGDGIDTVDYSGSIGVDVDLNNQRATGIGTDTLLSIENVIGSDSNDTIEGSSASNNLQGGLGDDILSFAGSSNSVTINMLAGSASGDGNDTFSGFEQVIGSSNNDTFTGGISGLILDGNGGTDTVNYSNEGTLNVELNSGDDSVETDTLKNIESYILSDNDDTISVSSEAAYNEIASLDAGNGTDIIHFTSSVDGETLVLGNSTTNVEKIIVDGSANINVDLSGVTYSMDINGNSGNNTIVIDSDMGTIDGVGGTNTLDVRADLDLGTIDLVHINNIKTDNLLTIENSQLHNKNLNFSGAGSVSFNAGTSGNNNYANVTSTLTNALIMIVASTLSLDASDNLGGVDKINITANTFTLDAEQLTDQIIDISAGKNLVINQAGSTDLSNVTFIGSGVVTINVVDGSDIDVSGIDVSSFSGEITIDDGSSITSIIGTNDNDTIKITTKPTSINGLDANGDKLEIDGTMDLSDIAIDNIEEIKVISGTVTLKDTQTVSKTITGDGGITVLVANNNVDLSNIQTLGTNIAIFDSTIDMRSGSFGDKINDIEVLSGAKLTVTDAIISNTNISKNVTGDGEIVVQISDDSDVDFSNLNATLNQSIEFRGNSTFGGDFANADSIEVFSGNRLTLSDNTLGSHDVVGTGSVTVLVDTSLDNTHDFSNLLLNGANTKNHIEFTATNTFEGSLEKFSSVDISSGELSIAADIVSGKNVSGAGKIKVIIDSDSDIDLSSITVGSSDESVVFTNSSVFTGDFSNTGSIIVDSGVMEADISKVNGKTITNNSTIKVTNLDSISDADLSNISGGTLNVFSDGDVDFSGNIGSSNLVVSSGVMTLSDSVTISNASSITVDGELIANATKVSGDTIDGNGTITINNLDGKLDADFGNITTTNLNVDWSGTDTYTGNLTNVDKLNISSGTMSVDDSILGTTVVEGNALNVTTNDSSADFTNVNVSTLTINDTTSNISITGSSNGDILNLSSGDDILNLGDGDDTINVDMGDITSSDTIDGAGGSNDTIHFNTSGTLDFSNLNDVSNIEKLEFSSGTNHVQLADNSAFDSFNNFVVTEADGSDDSIDFDSTAITGDLDFTNVSGFENLNLSSVADNITISGDEPTTINGLDGDDTFTKSFDNNTTHIDGVTGSNTVNLTGTRTADDTNFDGATNVSNIDILDIRNLTLDGADDQELIITKEMIQQWSDADDDITLKLTADQAENIQVTADDLNDSPDVGTTTFTLLEDTHVYDFGDGVTLTADIG